MGGLLSFFFMAAFFYLMMRCGAHMVHGGHSGHGKHDRGGQKHVDPVCGKEVSPEQGYGKMHEGRLYRFCTRSCLDKFEAEPEKYRETPKELSS